MPLTLTLLMKPPHLLTVSLNSQSLVLMSVFLGPFGCLDLTVGDLVFYFTQDRKRTVSTLLESFPLIVLLPGLLDGNHDPRSASLLLNGSPLLLNTEILRSRRLFRRPHHHYHLLQVSDLHGSMSLVARSLPDATSSSRLAISHSTPRLCPLVPDDDLLGSYSPWRTHSRPQVGAIGCARIRRPAIPAECFPFDYLNSFTAQTCDP